MKTCATNFQVTFRGRRHLVLLCVSLRKEERARAHAQLTTRPQPCDNMIRK